MSHTTAYYENLAQGLSIPAKAVIDGRLVHAQSGASFETLNPASTLTIGEVTSCDAGDVDLAVKAARKSFEGGVWSRVGVTKRKNVLVTLAGLIRENSEQLAILESLDTGKPITDCLNEIGNEVPKFFQWYAELLDKSYGKVAPTENDVLALITEEPIGVVGLVLPWNFPLLITAWKVAPALAAGCSIVLKPAEQSPLTSIRLAELALEAGLPDGVFNVVPGTGEIAGKALGLHSDVDAVSFTGSSEVGALFLRYASDSNLKRVALEMGGKSPLIVLGDAEITEDLINHAALAAYWNAGQNCSANMRQLVDVSKKDEFIEKLLGKIRSIKIGNPLDPSTEVGPMITASHRDRVRNFIKIGRDEGATAVEGADVPAKGFYIPPVLFTDVTPDMTIAREEIFGPVLGVIATKGPEDALRIARDTKYGLHASIFTADFTKGYALARRIPCGTVSINCFSEGDVTTPFGGYKLSGSAARDKGLEAMQQYQQTKTIWSAIGPGM
ncbi:MAG: aldehyde dehydrogenase family protein [Mesorhizobium sp.]|uniref:aldehyde dehydrogenase n=1 Tax=unclassified Mesorhizobium TaxID=325217 RepID=UPI000FC9DABB|nr:MULTISPECIES: aldehyde dehydrogenase [unclassified Mesorhizobium]RUW83328.1 aldehyde dehydrogenase [Mesorhizobium sp. M1E.F.Ca.ET.063.01.1.1]TIW08900.1 MAG: aldehyde dehydrogenase family protein [Mesorhizobium sp.]